MEQEDKINWSSPKFAEKDRTFETRLKFIDSIFSNKFDNGDILGRCIQWKLKGSFERYEQEIHESLWNLDGEDPIKIMKNLDS